MSDTPLTDAQEMFIITPPPTDKKEGVQLIREVRKAK